MTIDTSPIVVRRNLRLICAHVEPGGDPNIPPWTTIGNLRAGLWLMQARDEARKRHPHDALPAMLKRSGIILRSTWKEKRERQAYHAIATIRAHVGRNGDPNIPRGTIINGEDYGRWLQHACLRAREEGPNSPLALFLKDNGINIGPRERRHDTTPSSLEEARKNLSRIREHVGHGGDMNLHREAVIDGWKAGIWLKNTRERAVRNGEGSPLATLLAEHGVKLRRGTPRKSPSPAAERPQSARPARTLTEKTRQRTLKNLHTIREHLGLQAGAPITLPTEATIGGWAAGKWLVDARARARRLGPTSELHELLTHEGVDPTKRESPEISPEQARGRLERIEEHKGKGEAHRLHTKEKIGDWEAGTWLAAFRATARRHGEESWQYRLLAEFGISAGSGLTYEMARETLDWIEERTGKGKVGSLYRHDVVDGMRAGAWLERLRVRARHAGEDSWQYRLLTEYGVNPQRSDRKITPEQARDRLQRIEAHIGRGRAGELIGDAKIGPWNAGAWLGSFRARARREGPGSWTYKILAEFGVDPAHKPATRPPGAKPIWDPPPPPLNLSPRHQQTPIPEEAPSP